eukprot:CAMPEP_0170734838 /NCGR_PEP_ID=MMETSP0437-20130122/2795_1 /TAXON_ID=0 /ORGANISM="Sexangularia sp." /LENGTH=331 /DNA_ID=CAMNT_0011073161 /DNA_START=98 /DNA_END=1093 /DNA_ORIENTATION=+
MSILSPRSNASLGDISAKNYKDQAIWFINAWIGQDATMVDNCEEIWKIIKKFAELDLEGPTKKGVEGNELDSFLSARLLETLDSAMTALERKAAFAKIDLDSNGCISAIEYLLWKYEKDVGATVNAPQEADSEALEKAKAKMAAVQASLDETRSKLEATAATVAKLKADEAELATAEADLSAALAELKAQEDAYAAKIAELTDASSAGGVKGAKAANELAQLKEEDPLPLRKSKITQEAALRKVQKAKAAVEESRRQQEAAQAELDAAYVELQGKMAECEEELNQAAQKMTAGKGTIAWMKRELHEADFYLPTKQRKFDHTKDFDWKAAMP